ncbi:hypothetical protein BDR07DRAFT_1461345 [Suillus spraguei]|nr:hypothetical protein BDR07DRAFT_1461345 [Suillus spraguei]
MSEDYVRQPHMKNTLPDPKALGFHGEATASESSIGRHGNLIHKFWGKDKNGVTAQNVNKLTLYNKHFSHRLDPVPVLSNVDREDTPNIEDVPPLAVTAVKSAHANVDDLLATNLQPLRIFNHVARTLADVHPLFSLKGIAMKRYFVFTTSWIKSTTS